jgi:cobalt-zinc-cadmium efflux system outer membrane protein
MKGRTGLGRIGCGLAWLLLLPWCQLIAATPPEAVLPSPRELPLDEEQPAGGLSLDEAIGHLLQRNYDLRVKSQDIPKARADILSAGLRNNPSVFFSADNIPYGNYSPQRPGEVDYELTLIQPSDLNNKRRRRIRLAERAERVTEALYQDAVRQTVDQLYTAYTDVVEAEIGVQFAQTDVALQSEGVKSVRDLVRQGLQPRAELTRAQVTLGRAESSLRRAEANLLQSRRHLAVLLVVPPDQADCLTLGGQMHDKAPVPPCVDDLIRLALHIRPDLAAYRLNVNRAQAQLQRTRAERIDDVILFYTPYQIQDFPGQAAQAAPGWEAGALVVVPVFDRRQGDIARTNVEITQAQTEVQGMEQQIINEVRQAAADYAVSRQSVARYEQEILPGAQSVRAEKQRLYASGRVGIDVSLAAQRDYNDAVRQYREALLRHRRAMLKLNTAVGQRLLP